MIKDPETGKRVSRPNLHQDRDIKDVPEVRIVPADLFQKAINRKRQGRRNPAIPSTLANTPSATLRNVRFRYVGER
jgi:hypothetical protein